MKLLPHLIGACVVTAMLCWTIVRVLTRYGAVEHLRKPAQTSAGAADVSTRPGLRRLSFASDLWPQRGSAVADHGGQHGGARGLWRTGAGGQRRARDPEPSHDQRARSPIAQLIPRPGRPSPHEQRHSAARRSSRRHRLACPRLLRAHQSARHHPDRDDRLGRRLFCRCQIGRARRSRGRCCTR